MSRYFPTENIPKGSRSGHHSLVVPQDAHEALDQDFTVKYQWTDDGPMVYSTVDAPLGYHDNLEDIDVCDPWAAVKGADTLGWQRDIDHPDGMSVIPDL